MLRVNNLSIKYSVGEEGETLKVLDNINFTADKGQVIVITGMSGCGKSSLIKSINGIIPFSQHAEVEGEITLDGISLKNLDIAARSNYVSSVFQNPKTQFFTTKVIDELSFPLENRGVSRDEIMDKIHHYSKILDTESYLESSLFKLSGGEKQLIAICSTATMENQVYIFDEPSSSLDRDSIKRLKQVIATLKSMGKIIIIAEHRLYYLREILDKLVVIEKGRLTAYSKDDDLEKAARDHNLRSLMPIEKSVLKPIKKSMFDNLFQESRLICKDYYCAYGENVVFDMSLSFHPGINFIIGNNGIGKSTFIRSLSGLNKSKKELNFQGLTMYDDIIIKKNNRFISLVQQEVDYQLFTDSVKTELETICDDEKRINDLLNYLHLSERAEAHPQSLSGGEKQRLLIGLSLLSDKPIVILDEPTSGLCKTTMELIIRLIHMMKIKVNSYNQP